MRSAGVYVRISKDRHGAGLGVERQEAECRALCEAKGWAVAAVFVDNDVSAYSGKRRPGYDALLAAIETSDVDAVVAWHPDRLHRSPKELERFIDIVEQAGTHVATVQGGEYDLSTAAGRMTARVVGAVARHESEHKSERARSKAAQLAQAGAVAGGGTRPFGYLDDRVTVEPVEAAVVRDLVAKLIAGRSLRSLATELNERGITTTSGNEWRASPLRRMLTSGRIAGLRTHKGAVTGPAVWPAIITPDDRERALSVLQPRPGVVRPRSYLLAGLAVCSGCRTKLLSRPRADHRSYVCARDPGTGGCGQRRIKAEPFEAWVVQRFLAALDDGTLRPPTPVVVVDDIAALEQRLDELAVDWADGTLDRRSWLAARTKLTERIDAARARVAASVRAEAAAAIPAAGRAAWWEGLDFDQQRAVLSTVVERVDVGAAVVGRNYFDADRVSITWRW